MATQKAIVVLDEGKKAGVLDAPIPKVKDEWVLVKVNAVALNPTDWKHIDYGAADPGSKIGCDFAGVVEEVGGKVTKFKKGDRISGMCHGGDSTNHDNGSFSRYAIAKAAVSIKTPDNLSDEQAATLGVSVFTVGQGLYKSLGLPLPNSPSKESSPLLIYGGSTATGVLGIQYAKASGLSVIATSSPHNFDYLKSLGADEVFDYNSPSCAADIKKYTSNKLKYAWDCTGNGAELCATATTDSETSIYGAIVPVDEQVLKSTNPKIDGPRLTLAYDIFGETYNWRGTEFPPKPDEQEFATKFATLSEELLANGTVKTIKIAVNKTGEGLEGILSGLDEMRAGKVSSTKLVYTLS